MSLETRLKGFWLFPESGSLVEFPSPSLPQGERESLWTLAFAGMTIQKKRAQGKNALEKTEQKRSKWMDVII